MRIQLWSYFYDPEPQGIAPLSRIVAKELAALGNDVEVVTSHPHYPEPVWGTRLRPYRESRDGISVLRLPLWIGRSTAAERMREELSFTAMQSLVAPILPSADVMLVVTPCFPALLPAMLNSKLRRMPWVMWLQDFATDAAATTGLVKSGPLLAAASRFERATYKSAEKIIAISESFRTNLISKGVVPTKIERVFNPAPRPISGPLNDGGQAGLPPRILVMGNIGHSQGLDAVVRAFQESRDLEKMDARLVIAGHGVAEHKVKTCVTSDRVQMLGVIGGERLDKELRSASIGLVSQRADITEFNFPSKLMNYMACGVPVLASVRPDSETARVVVESGAGKVTDAAEPSLFADMAARMIRNRSEREMVSAAGFSYAAAHFDPQKVAGKIETVLRSALDSAAG